MGDLDQRPGAPAATLSRPEDPASTRAAILAGASRCIARWGLAKTTVDDIAREAGVSRATVYRSFGTKDEILVAVAAYEEGRFFAEVGPKLESCSSLQETLAVAICEASQFLSENEMLGYLGEHEPEVLLPHLAFSEIGPLLYRATAFLAPYLERFLPAELVPEVAEWATRLVISHWMKPSERLHLGDPSGALHVVSRYLLPGIQPLAHA